MRKAAISGTILAGILFGGPGAAQGAEPEWSELFSIVEMKPTIGISTGYDSNPEEFVGGGGSAFKRLDAGLRLTMGDEDTTQAVAGFSGSVIGYSEPDLEKDYDHAVGVELSHRLNPQVRISAGVNRNVDGSDDPVTKATEAFTLIAIDLPKLQWTFRGTVADYREVVSARDIEEFDLETYDYLVRAGVMRTELAKDSKIRPVVEVGLARLDYERPRPGKRNRDATEYFIIAGAELDLTDELELRLGLRRNERIFDESGDGSFASTGPDVSLEWEPNQKVEVEFSVARTLEEPTREDSVVEDVFAAQAKVTLQAREKLTLTAGATFETVDLVRADERKTELSLSAGTRWQMREQLAFLIEAWTQREHFEQEDETVDRTLIRAGVEATF